MEKQKEHLKYYKPKTLLMGILIFGGCLFLLGGTIAKSIIINISNLNIIEIIILTIGFIIGENFILIASERWR